MICLKTILMVLNLLVWASGVLLITAGVWLVTEWNSIQLALELNELLQVSGWIFIGIGIFIVLMSSVAFLGVLKDKPKLLHINGVFLLAVFILEVICIYGFSTHQDTILNKVDQALNATMISYSNGNLKPGMKFIQTNLHCCGSRSYYDWKQLDSPLDILESCCVNQKQCLVLDPKYVYTKGCYEVIEKFLRSYFEIIIGVAVGNALIPLMALFISCYLAHRIKNEYKLF